MLTHMGYGDRFTITDKNFGRKMVMKILRGKPKWDQRKRELTVIYEDSPERGPRTPRQKSRPKPRI